MNSWIRLLSITGPVIALIRLSQLLDPSCKTGLERRPFPIDGVDSFYPLRHFTGWTQFVDTLSLSRKSQVCCQHYPRPIPSHFSVSLHRGDIYIVSPSPPPWQPGQTVWEWSQSFSRILTLRLFRSKTVRFNECGSDHMVNISMGEIQRSALFLFHFFLKFF